MGKFDGVLICTDLDGTLFKNDKTISRENKDAIEYFKREGGYFTFITGRMPYYSLEAYNAVQPNVPFGCINGGGVYDGFNNKYVWTCNLPSEAFELIKCVDESFPDVGIQVCTFDKTYFSKDNDVMVDFRKVTNLPNLVRNYHDVSEPIAKIIFGTDRDEEIFAIDKMLHKHPLAENFDFIRSQKTLYEILPNGVNKGLALFKLAEYLNIDISRTIGIGDYDNDVGMFNAAGIGIAVSNACPAALAAADYITVSNEEHALAQVICDLEAGKLNLKQ